MGPHPIILGNDFPLRGIESNWSKVTFWGKLLDFKEIISMAADRGKKILAAKSVIKINFEFQSIPSTLLLLLCIFEF